MTLQPSQAYTIHEGLNLIDWDRVHGWLSCSYWSPGINLEEVQRAAHNSALVIGAYDERREQVGYARVVSDKTRFAYLCDVWVESGHRRKGLARAMAQFALQRPELATVKWMLATKDAHQVYIPLGFAPLASPGNFLTRSAPPDLSSARPRCPSGLPPVGVEVIGIDHIYVAVSDMARSENFYDTVMATLGFKKNTFTNEGERHVQYFNRHFGYVLRPARAGSSGYEPLAPGLHHFCFRVEDTQTVNSIAEAFRRGGIQCSKPQLYPEYAPDYYAIFFADPDGIRLEVTNYRQERRRRFADWPNVS